MLDGAGVQGDDEATRDRTAVLNRGDQPSEMGGRNAEVVMIQAPSNLPFSTSCTTTFRSALA